MCAILDKWNILSLTLSILQFLNVADTEYKIMFFADVVFCWTAQF